MEEDFWMLCVYGKWYRISADVKDEVLEKIEQLPMVTGTKPQIMQTYDLYGSTIYVDAAGVSSIYESTAAIRKADNEHSKWLNKELDEPTFE